MDITVDFGELERLEGALTREERAEVTKRVNRAITTGIDWLHARAVADAPRETGVLAASIVKDDGRKGHARRVFTTGKNLPPKESGARHGFFQEFGTSRRGPAQPFLLVHANRAGEIVATALTFLSEEILQE